MQLNEMEFSMFDDQPSATRCPEATESVRPPEYSAELGEKIGDRLVDNDSLQSICAEPGMPDVATIASWISSNFEFREEYALAREDQALRIAREAIDVADAMSTAWVEKVRANGRVVRGPVRKNLARCRLRLAVRNWVSDELFARAHRLMPVSLESKSSKLFPSMSPP
jgi:hypothetical protein